MLDYVRLRAAAWRKAAATPGSARPGPRRGCRQGKLVGCVLDQHNNLRVAKGARLSADYFSTLLGAC